MPLSPTDYETLSAMISPALFMTATGSLIISTSNRMSRIVDRIRTLNDRGDEIGRGISSLDYPNERRQHIDDQLRRLVSRSDRIRFALAMLYCAFAAFVGTSLAIGVDVLAEHTLIAVPSLMAAVGVTLMLGATINLIREALEALRSSRLEIRFYEELRRRRENDAAPATVTAPVEPVTSTKPQT
jgi:hypothetical protein